MLTRPLACDFLPIALEKSLRGIGRLHGTSYYGSLNEAEQTQLRAALKEFICLAQAEEAA